MIKLTPSQNVLDKIAALEDESDRDKCFGAYSFLMTSTRSKYAFFVNLQEQLIANGGYLSTFDLEKTIGIECTLWPNLYPYTDWCESNISGKHSRHSVKVSFMTKVTSEILDYSLHFDLMQFHYDRWLYKVISGAINTARFSNCSPARALDSKHFSVTYWQWQHRYLLDAVEQFGLPDVFVTLSPYEWSFPFPEWLKYIRNTTGRGPTELAAHETLHICHVLEQIVRGYLCGSTTNRWSDHVFSYNKTANQDNIKTYFYRFEFQQRGTAHLHLLVWLKNIAKIQHSFIRADIPKQYPMLSYLVSELQSSNEKSHCLNLQDHNTFFDKKDGRNLLHLKHPADAFAVNLRAYISTLTPVLKCSMDFQTTNGISMILKYVTSYVTKCHNSTEVDGLYLYNLLGRQAAINHLISSKPAEPEMWLSLSSKKIAWSCSRTKRFTVPKMESAAGNNTLQKYCQRPNSYDTLSLIEWLRIVDEKKKNPKGHKKGSTLVGVQILSILNPEFFFQYNLLHLPHRKLEQVLHPSHVSIPPRLQGNAAAFHHFPNLWTNDDNITSMLSVQGHRDCYVRTVLSYIQSIRDLFHAWQLKIISSSEISQVHSPSVSLPELDHHQLAAKHCVVNLLSNRARHYNCGNKPLYIETDISSSDSEDEMTENASVGPLPAAYTDELQWQKPVLVTGKAGCGKSCMILSTILELLENGISIVVACPTGFLSNAFKAQLPDEVTCETIHSAFHYPVSPEEKPTVNWLLSQFDLIIIDELSMIPESIFNHVLSTLNKLIFRPVLVLCGDDRQQQPFSSKGTKITNVPSPLCNLAFVQSTHRFHLTNQHRVWDKRYLQFLDHIRNWVPTQTLLDEIQAGCVLAPDGIITNEIIANAYRLNTNITFLTFTKNACNQINSLATDTFFENMELVAVVKMDNSLNAVPVYKNMRVMITQNRDKINGIVNGQMGIIQSVQNETIFLKLSSGKIVPIYQVTCTDNGTTSTPYARPKAKHSVKLLFGLTLIKFRQEQHMLHYLE
jgi:hypothetical protein